MVPGNETRYVLNYQTCLKYYNILKEQSLYNLSLDPKGKWWNGICNYYVREVYAGTKFNSMVQPWLQSLDLKKDM